MKILIVGLVLTVLTVMIHSIGTMLAVSRSAPRLTARNRSGMETFVVMALLVVFLLATHLVEVALWAALYLELELLPDLTTAAYYSMTSYSTVGYGDVVLSSEWRLLGPIEAVVGVLMMGWSTAIIVAVVQMTNRDSAEADPPR
jgi:hypothetical protein